MLEKCKQLILTGAPGTGKTYRTKEIAKKVVGVGNCSANIAFCQFHPSYDYTDFVEGLRPVRNTGGMSIEFDLQDGIFKMFCKEALKHPEQKYVFIIDEINRGDISKIFGELFYSIDAGYRGEKGRVKTQYSNLIKEGDAFKNGFYVPDNFYIIGTMNDIDRSVESMDFAMRRRFAWVEVTAEESAIIIDAAEKIDDGWKTEAKTRMSRLNAEIVKDEYQLGTAYQIGGAYFKKIEMYADLNEVDAFQALWDHHLSNVLHEYLRGTPKAKEQLVALKMVYDVAVV